MDPVDDGWRCVLRQREKEFPAAAAILKKAMAEQGMLAASPVQE